MLKLCPHTYTICWHSRLCPVVANGNGIMEVTLVKNKTMFDKWRAVNHKDAPFSWDSSIDRFIEEEHFLK